VLKASRSNVANQPGSELPKRVDGRTLLRLVFDTAALRGISLPHSLSVSVFFAFSAVKTLPFNP